MTEISRVQMFIGTSVLHNSSQEVVENIIGSLKNRAARDNDLACILNGPVSFPRSPWQAKMAKLGVRLGLGELVDMNITRNQQGRIIEASLSG